MSKSLYSLILSDKVVAAVDGEAVKRGTNRSSLINEILAEYLQVETPEQQMRNIFAGIDKLIGGYFEALLPSNSRSMALKTSLDYKYRPTVKYELELSKTPESDLGTLKVQWRTTSGELTVRIDEFIKIWMAVESKYCKNVIGYVYEDNKFQRTFALPPGIEFNISYISNGIGKYIRLFDKALKGYATGVLKSAEDVDEFYKKFVLSMEEFI